MKDICARCGGQMAELDYDKGTLGCIMCGWRKYIPIEMPTPDYLRGIEPNQEIEYGTLRKSFARKDV